MLASSTKTTVLNISRRIFDLSSFRIFSAALVVFVVLVVVVVVVLRWRRSEGGEGEGGAILDVLLAWENW